MNQLSEDIKIKIYEYVHQMRFRPTISLMKEICDINKYQKDIIYFNDEYLKIQNISLVKIKFLSTSLMNLRILVRCLYLLQKEKSGNNLNFLSFLRIYKHFQKFNYCLNNF